jgi:hypothetical protein
LDFICNDASNSNGYIAKDSSYLLIEVQCKIRHLGSRNVSVDSFEGVNYLNDIPYSNKNYFDEDKINNSVKQTSDYFKVPFPLVPGDQKNVNLFIQIPIAYNDQKKGLNKCTPNENKIELGIINRCYIDKLQRPIPNYLYESIDFGGSTLNDVGLRVFTSDSKSYDAKITFDHIGFKPNDNIYRLSSKRDLPGHDKWFMKEVKYNDDKNVNNYINLRDVIASILFMLSLSIFYIIRRFKFGKMAFIKNMKIQHAFDFMVLLLFLLIIIADSLMLFGLNIFYVLFG